MKKILIIIIILFLFSVSVNSGIHDKQEINYKEKYNELFNNYMHLADITNRVLDDNIKLKEFLINNIIGNFEEQPNESDINISYSGTKFF